MLFLTAYLFTGLGFALNDMLAQAELPDNERWSVLEALVVSGVLVLAWPAEIFFALWGRG